MSLFHFFLLAYCQCGVIIYGRVWAKIHPLHYLVCGVEVNIYFGKINNLNKIRGFSDCVLLYIIQMLGKNSYEVTFQIHDRPVLN